MDAIHSEAFDKLRGMLSKEIWQKVPVTEAVTNSIMDSTQGGLKHRLTKGAYATIAAATAAIKGTDMLADSAADASGEASNMYRTYSDGASLFVTWLDRGNPFGGLTLLDGGRGGAGVLPTPRPVIDDDDDDDEEEEEDAAPSSGVSAAEAASDEAIAKAEADAVAAEAAKAVAAQRRAAARMLRFVHGEDYALEVGLGRGPGLGFSLAVAGSAALRRGVDSDEDEGQEEEITDVGRSSDDDSDDDDAALRKDGSGASTPTRGRRGAGAAGGDDDSTFRAGGTATGPYANVLGGAHQHVVTAAALNGFARTVGKYMLLMEMLPTVAPDAFTGLAHLFELYLFTVATIFIRPGALKALWALPTPAPLSAEPEHNLAEFDFLDGTSYAAVVRAAACAVEARTADHRQLGSPGRPMALRRGTSGFSGLASTATGDDDDSTPVAATSRRKGGERSDHENVEMYGVTVYMRGLPALAQAQGLPLEYYSPTGAGAAAGTSMSGNAYNFGGLFVLLRRSLQLIGFMLSQGTATRTGTASILAEGALGHDTGLSSAGIAPELYIKLQSSVEVEGDAAGFGVNERSVAIESLDFMIDVMARVRPRLETYLPAAQAAAVSTFYTHAVLVACQVRALAYHSLVPRLLPESGAIPNMIINNVKWEGIRDAVVPNPYVALITAPLSRAAGMLNDRVTGGALPAVSRLALWCCITNHVTDRFIEGVSRVKKCSVPGRGLMGLDVGALYNHCVKTGPALPACISRDADLARAYVSAFYFDNDGDLLQWMLAHKAQFPLRHMRALLMNGIGPNLKRKQLKDVTAALEAQYMEPPVPGAAPTGALAGMTAVFAGAAAVMGGGSS